MSPPPGPTWRPHFGPAAAFWQRLTAMTATDGVALVVTATDGDAASLIDVSDVDGTAALLATTDGSDVDGSLAPVRDVVAWLPLLIQRPRPR